MDIITAQWLYMCACVHHSIVSNSCDPMDYSPPGSPVPGILQARTLEWVAIPFSRIFPTQGLALQADSLPSEPPGKPHINNVVLHIWKLLREGDFKSFYHTKKYNYV